MAFKETLVAAREQRGMTQQDLAEKLYVTRQAVSRWENGETEPSVDMRKLIATVLDVPVIQLFDIDVSQLCQCCGALFTILYCIRLICHICRLSCSFLDRKSVV